MSNGTFTVCRVYNVKSAVSYLQVGTASSNIDDVDDDDVDHDVDHDDNDDDYDDDNVVYSRLYVKNRE